MINLSLLFNKIYYEELGASSEQFANHLAECNRKLCEARFDEARDYRPMVAANSSFRLMTSYPGFLVGIGNPHGVKSKSSKIDSTDVSVGFSFDFVSGQPYVPGSSVKGVLRHCFDTHPGVISLLGYDGDVGALTDEIFDGGDVFFDAVIARGGAGGRVMGADYITPHDRKGTKSPIPIHIVKIIPEVVIEFRFRLSDGLVSKEKKLEIFKKLMMLFGAGAKTNVGYGVLREVAPVNRTYSEPKAPNIPPRNGAPVSGGADKIKCPHCGRLNYRFNQSTGKENFNWQRGECFSCRKKLNNK